METRIVRRVDANAQMPDTARFYLCEHPLEQRLLNSPLFVIGTLCYEVINPRGFHAKLLAVPGQHTEAREAVRTILSQCHASTAILVGQRFKNAFASEVDQIRSTKAVKWGHRFERPYLDQRKDLFPILGSAKSYVGVVHLAVLRTSVIKMSRRDRTQPAVRQRILRSSNTDCRSTYSRSRRVRAAHEITLRPLICASPVMPGFTTRRRHSSA